MAPRNRVKLLHPGYEDAEILLMLPAVDGARRDSTPYAVAHAAAAIVANNRFDGWLSISSKGEPPLDSTVDLIPAGNYYFHVPSDNGEEPYPIIPNFQNWRFPHERDLPTVWKEIRDSSVVQPAGTPFPSQDSEPCRVTGRQLALESAHIIPTSEKQWFGANRMDQYGELGSRSGDSVADTATNRMRLTCDAHRLFDSGYYTIVPKTRLAAEATAEAKGGKTFEALGWYTHMLNEHEELYTHWHNIPVELPDRATEFLFTRFAWEIFPKLQGFVHSGPPRWLAVYSRETNRYEVRNYKQFERRIFTLDQGRGRSASPTKRQRSTQNADCVSTEEWAKGPANSMARDTHISGQRKRQRSSPTQTSDRQDSATLGMPDLDERNQDASLICEHFSDRSLSDDHHQRHSRPARSPDFVLPRGCMETDPAHYENHRGRKRRRSTSGPPVRCLLAT
jgi:hypothetical protein